MQHLISMGFRDYNYKKFIKKKDFCVQIVSKNIFILNYYSHQKLCNSIMRFLSKVDLFPEIKSPLSHKEFKKMYRKKHGSFSFREDWVGFLIPGKAIKPFLKGDWNPLSKDERNVLSLFKNQKGNFAIVGLSPESSPTTLRHELAHALFEVNKEYRKEVIRVLKEEDLTDIFKILKDNGYNDHVLEDEAQAYLMNNLSWLKKEGLKKIERFYKICAKLNFIFDKHAGSWD